MKKLYKFLSISAIALLFVYGQLTAADIKLVVAGPHTGAYAASGEQLW